MMKSQIKTQNLTSTIRKIAKRLTKFTISDIIRFSEAEEAEIIEVLEELEKDKIIKKLSNTEYLYSKIKQTEDVVLNLVPNVIIDNIQEECVKKLSQINFLKNENFANENQKIFKDEEEQKVFDNASVGIKEMIIKYLTVFKMLEKLRGQNIQTCLKEIGKQNKNYEIKYSTFMRKRKKFINYGVKGLIPKYGQYERKNSNLELEMYEDFKTIYLSPNGPPLETAVNLLTKYGHKKELLPCTQTFKRMLTKEFSKEAIHTMRQPILKIPNIKTDEIIKKKDSDKIYYETFMEAAEDFLKIDNKNNVTIHMRGYLKNHLIPYFENFRFDEITQEDIIKFQSKILSEGFSSASVGMIMSTLSKIYRTYAKINPSLKFSSKNNILEALETKHLQDKEILEIKKKHSPELWIICLGINIGELLALKYKDIDFENKTVKIDKMSHQNVIQAHRRLYRIRTLKLPDCIFQFLDKNKSGVIFNKINIENYDILLNTHIHLMLEKNIQINLISKNLGYRCLNDFEARFNFMLPQKLDDNFEII
jgi:hypothetical protein